MYLGIPLPIGITIVVNVVGKLNMMIHVQSATVKVKYMIPIITSIVTENSIRTNFPNIAKLYIFFEL